MEILIPDAWKTAVARILRRGAAGQVLIRRRARQDWAERFFETFEYELREALANALDQPGLRGQPEHGMTEPGEVYAFIF